MIDPDELALRSACRAAPTDDLPRLVYADWLQEHGRAELAELIRVQCEEADYFRQRECKFECKGEGPPGPIWCSQCQHDPKCCTCESGEDLWPLRQRMYNDLIPAVEFALSFRTKRAVEAEKRTMGGCCDRHTDRMACDCLDRAVDLTWDRGFAVVKCRLAEWVGGACEAVGPYHGDRCSGGRVHSPNAQFTRACFHCFGTGDDQGIGRTLTAAVPVGRIDVIGREPANTRGQGKVSRVFAWFADDAFENRNPPRVLVVPQHTLPRMLGLFAPGQRRRNFNTSDDAFAALSTVLISLAESTEPAPVRVLNTHGA